MTEKSADGKEVRLPTTKFYVPGSVLQVSVDNTLPISYGMPGKLDVFYDNSPAFQMSPGADLKNTHTIASFDTPHPLRSGWAWGEDYLEGAVEAVDAKVGEGHVYLFAPEITFRGKPHGTFKFLFNAIDLAGSHGGEYQSNQMKCSATGTFCDTTSIVDYVSNFGRS